LATKKEEKQFEKECKKARKERMKRMKEEGIEKYLTPDQIRYNRRKALIDSIWPIFRFLILFGLGFIILYPMIFMISTAFRPSEQMNDPSIIWLPKSLTMSNIEDVWKIMDYGNTALNTVLLNLIASVLEVLSCSITGYGFARFRFRGSKLLFGIVILMILVPTQVIALPLYGQFRFFGFGSHTVNLIDTMWTMYLPAMTANGIRAGLMIFLFRQFFRGLPREIEDAAYIDGCGPFMTFVRVMAPNASAAFLTVFLFSLVWYWNDYYVSSTFFTNSKTVALMLQNLDAELKIRLFKDAKADISPREQIVWKEAGCLLSIAPVLAVYVLLQKHFTEGIARSGITGM